MPCRRVMADIAQPWQPPPIMMKALSSSTLTSSVNPPCMAIAGLTC